jgi:hypothetical protein
MEACHHQDLYRWHVPVVHATVTLTLELKKELGTHDMSHPPAWYMPSFVALRIVRTDDRFS